MGMNHLYISKCLYGYTVWLGLPRTWLGQPIGWRPTRSGALRLAARARKVLDADPEVYQ